MPALEDTGRIERMLVDRLPDAPGLMIALYAERMGDSSISSTGIHPTKAGARDRCVSELAERRALSGQATQPLGSAAHPNKGEALTRAIHEAVERLAAGLWWNGRHAAALDPYLLKEARRLEATWQKAPTAHSGFWDVSLPELPPVIVAWSAGIDQGSVCFGIACATDPVVTVAAAAKELCQMEFGLSLALRRHARGDPLSNTDALAVTRAGGMHLSSCPVVPRDMVDADREPVAQTVMQRLGQHAQGLRTEVLRDQDLNRWVALIHGRPRISETSAWPLYL